MKGGREEDTLRARRRSETLGGRGAGRKALTEHGERKVGDPEQDSDVLPHLADGEVEPARDEDVPGLLLVARTRVPGHRRALASDCHDPGEPRQELQGPSQGGVEGESALTRAGHQGVRGWERKKEKTEANNEIGRAHV